MCAVLLCAIYLGIMDRIRKGDLVPTGGDGDRGFLSQLFPDNTTVGTTYKNTADFDGSGASGDVTVTDRSSYLNKSLSKAEDLETGKKKLTWKTSVSVELNKVRCRLFLISSFSSDKTA